MEAITAEYTKELGLMPSDEVLDQESRALESFYRYEGMEAQTALRALPRSRVWQPNTMFMFYEFEDDPRDGRFLNPLDVTPQFDTAPSVCKLELEVETLHVDDLIRRMSPSRERPLELRLFVKAPLTIGGHRDWANWILCSAVDVFARKDPIGRDKRLVAFAEGSVPTRALAEQESIQIEKGRVRLNHGLWGHTRKNMFQHFFEPLAKSFEPPLLATAGLPALVPTTVRFLNKMIATYTAESELRDLWQTKSLDFAISKDVDRVFKLRPGHWVLIDSDYVKRNPDLEGHKLDFKFETFEILDPDDKPIDAAYLVSRIHLEPQASSD